MLVPIASKSSSREGRFAAILSILTLPGLDQTELAEWRSDLAARAATRPNLKRLAARLGRPDASRRLGLHSVDTARFIDDFDSINQDQVGYGIFTLERLLFEWRRFSAPEQFDCRHFILKGRETAQPLPLLCAMAAYLKVFAPMHTAAVTEKMIQCWNDFDDYLNEPEPSETAHNGMLKSLRVFFEQLKSYRYRPAADSAKLSVPQAELAISEHVKDLGIFKEAPAIVHWLDQQHYASNVKLRLREYAATRDIEDWTEWIAYFDAQDSENPFTKAREFCTTKATEAARQRAEALWNHYKETIDAKVAAAGAGAASAGAASVSQ